VRDVVHEIVARVRAVSVTRPRHAMRRDGLGNPARLCYPHGGVLQFPIWKTPP
jgi:hypothetical protein